jgi:hypothetical protein
MILFLNGKGRVLYTEKLVSRWMTKAGWRSLVNTAEKTIEPPRRQERQAKQKLLHFCIHPLGDAHELAKPWRLLGALGVLAV